MAKGNGAAAPRFLFDRMLGRLCRKVRMLGIDCELAGEGRSPWLLTDAENALRTAVTTATRRLDRAGPPPIVLAPSGTADMIAELCRKAGLEPDFAPFTLCLECNAPLREIAPEQARPRVPERIARDFSEFHECAVCGRVYWKGSHYDAMAAQVEKILERIT